MAALALAERKHLESTRLRLRLSFDIVACYVLKKEGNRVVATTLLVTIEIQKRKGDFNLCTTLPGN